LTYFIDFISISSKGVNLFKDYIFIIINVFNNDKLYLNNDKVINKIIQFNFTETLQNSVAGSVSSSTFLFEITVIQLSFKGFQSFPNDP
jgi:hypothetical protein